MFNTKTLKFISVLSFTTSAIFTMILINSGLNGLIASCLGVLMAICLELCKVGFFYEALTNIKLPVFVRCLLGGISFLLIVSSIIASAGYIQNQANITKNVSLKHSKEYEQLEEAKNLQKELMESKKQEIESLKTSYNQQIQELTQVKESYPSNYYTRKENIQKEINGLQSQLTKELSLKNSELESITKELQKPIDVSKVVVADTKGYTALFQTLATKVNKYNEYSEPTSGQELELYFYLMLSIIFEFVAVLTAYLSKIKSEETLNNTSFYNDNKHEKESKPHYKLIKNEQLPEDKEKRIIGFKNKDSNISKDELSKYVSFMYENAKGNIATGYHTISKNINVNVETCRKIKGYLEQSGVIKTEGNRTIILKSMEQL